MTRCISGLAILLLASALAAAESDPAGHDHAGHAHGAGHGHEGAVHALGVVTVAGSTVAIVLHGEAEAGGEAVVALAVEQGPVPAELRSWIGIQNGRGSVKALLRPDEQGGYHGHLEVPAALPEHSAVWLEVVNAEGARERGSVALPTAGHVHGAADHEGDGDEPGPAAADAPAPGHDHGDHDHGDHDHDEH